MDCRKQFIRRTVSYPAQAVKAIPVGGIAVLTAIWSAGSGRNIVTVWRPQWEIRFRVQWSDPEWWRL